MTPPNRKRLNKTQKARALQLVLEHSGDVSPAKTIAEGSSQPSAGGVPATGGVAQPGGDVFAAPPPKRLRRQSMPPK